MNIFILLGLSIHAVGIYYIPSSFLFAIPSVLSGKFNFNKQELNLILISTFIFLISLCFNFNANLTPLIKSFAILLSYPFSLSLGRNLVNYINISSKSKLKIFIFLLWLIVAIVILSDFLYYESSHISRLVIGLFLITSTLKINKYFFYKSNIFFIPIVFFIVYGLIRDLSLSFIGIVLSSIFILFVLFLIIFIKKIILRLQISKKTSLNFIYILIFSVLLLYISIYSGLLNSRRVSNFEYLLSLIFNLEGTKLLTLSGGRFLSSFEGYRAFFLEPLNLTSLGLDLPSIKDSLLLDSLVTRSSIDINRLLLFRPSSFFSWILYNCRILGLPFIASYFILLKKSFKIYSHKVHTLKTEKNIHILFITSQTYIFYCTFVASPPSFSLPIVLLSIISII